MLREFKTYGVVCNKCNRALKINDTVVYNAESGSNIQDVMEQAREQGWTIKRYYDTLCPVCGDLNVWLDAKIQSTHVDNPYYKEYDDDNFFIKGYHDAMKRFKEFLNSEN